jgi:hypothetical protein
MKGQIYVHHTVKKYKGELLIYVFICGLFNKVLSRSDYMALNRKMIKNYGIEKDEGGSGRGLCQGAAPQFCLGS